MENVIGLLISLTIITAIALLIHVFLKRVILAHILVLVIVTLIYVFIAMPRDPLWIIGIPLLLGVTFLASLVVGAVISLLRKGNNSKEINTPQNKTIKFIFFFLNILLVPLIAFYSYIGTLSAAEREVHLNCVVWGLLIIMWLLNNILFVWFLKRITIVLFWLLMIASICHAWFFLDVNYVLLNISICFFLSIFVILVLKLNKKHIEILD